MNKSDLEKRQERAETEPFIITKGDEGFRISSSFTPAKQYVVTGLPEDPRCTCPDFEHNKGDQEWRCKHILAVEQHVVRQNHHAGGTDAAGAAPSTDNSSPVAPPARQKRAARQDKSTAMLIKRSISPDGRIDSLSVEFTCPVGNVPADEIRQRAENALKLQTEIIGSFLDNNGNGNGNGHEENRSNEVPGAVRAQMLTIGGINGRYGRRLFIAMLVNGQTQSKLFGSRKELAEAIQTAGYPKLAVQIAEGIQLNVPCRVVTEPSRDGKYLNVARVLPVPAQELAGGTKR
jgi:hypothetical protein